MRRSTCAISLVLIGSGLILSGCMGCISQPQGTSPRDTRPSSGAPRGYSGGSHGVYYGGGNRMPVGGGVGSGTGESAAVGRGGFGGAGHAAGGS
jgi:hypothetical protein